MAVFRVEKNPQNCIDTANIAVYNNGVNNNNNVKKGGLYGY